MEHWIDDGDSDLGNYALLCGRDHDNVHNRGFTIDMINGKPRWVEPDWLRHPNHPNHPNHPRRLSD